MAAMRFVAIASLFLLLQLVALGVQQQPASPEDRAAARLVEITKRLASEKLAQLSTWQRREAERASATAAIHAEVTRFVESYIQSSEAGQTTLARLRAVLKPHQFDFDVGEEPTVRTADLRFGRSLVLAYTVARPPHFSKGLVFGFCVDAGQYRLVSTAGDEFEGYSMATHVLPPPSPGELWLLALGKAHTFNGSKMRFRVYRFDGQEFTTIWNPDDLFNAEAQVTSTGFVIKHIPRGLDYVTEEYVTSPGAILRVR